MLNGWLNDSIINCYGELLNARSALVDSGLTGSQAKKFYCFSTFFFDQSDANWLNNFESVYPSKRAWSRNIGVSIIQLDMVLFPINIRNKHWTLGVVDFQAKQFAYYDSGTRFNMGSGPAFLKAMREYVRLEALFYNQKEYDFTGWSDYIPDRLVQQANSTDCGAFVLKFAEHLSHGLDVSFAADMEDFRLKIASELKNAVALR